jgi:hypothetical protein
MNNFLLPSRNYDGILKMGGMLYGKTDKEE